jgi:uncharacterized protein (TIGR03435 family)
VARLALALIYALPLAAQTERPKFEVTSVRATAAGGQSGFATAPGGSDPGLFRCTGCTLLNLINRAYHLKWYQLSGPDWLRIDRFDISATIPKGSAREELPLMLQDLLATRFNLIVRRTTKEMAVYELKLIKDAHKMVAWADPPPGGQAPQSGTSNAPDGGVVRRMSGWTMEVVVSWLEIALQRPIVDQTGLKGKYDINLHYFPRPSADEPGPDLIEAVRTQLGLTLESAKHMIDVLVVDQVQRTPTEN